MKADYPIECVPATPEYILACIREEWRQSMLLDGEESDDVERQLPTFASTVHKWRETLDLVGWRPLGRALNEDWGTQFTKRQWFSVLMPAREKTLRGVCELLATQACRRLVPPAKMLGRECPSAGVFLAIRAFLVQAGAPPDLRPSTPLEPFLHKWPEVFLQQVSHLAPGGVPFTRQNEGFNTLIALSYILSGLLLLLGLFAKDPWMTCGAVILYGLGWIGAGCGGCFPGPLKLEAVNDFRGLTEAIVERQRRSGFGPENS
jgi:hypothetical protein